MGHNEKWTSTKEKSILDQLEHGVRLPIISGMSNEAVRRKMGHMGVAAPLHAPFPTAVEDYRIDADTQLETCPPFLNLSYDSWTYFSPDKSIPPEAMLDFKNGCARVPENWPLQLVQHPPALVPCKVSYSLSPLHASGQ